MWFVSISGNLWGKSVRIGSSRYHLVAEARRMRGFSIFSIQSNTFFQFKQMHFFNSNKYISWIWTNTFVSIWTNTFVSIWKNTCLQFEQIQFFNLNKFISSIWTNTFFSQFEHIHFFLNLNKNKYKSVWIGWGRYHLLAEARRMSSFSAWL